MKRYGYLVLGVWLLSPGYLIAEEKALLPHFEPPGNTRQLMVDGQPFVMVAGELQNYSASGVPAGTHLLAARKAQGRRASSRAQSEQAALVPDIFHCPSGTLIALPHHHAGGLAAV